MTKKTIRLLALVFAMLFMTACGDKPAADPDAGHNVAAGDLSSIKINVGTGGSTGTYYGYGNILGRYIKDGAAVDVTVVSTGGSKANIQGIEVGDYQLATVQSDVMSYAWDGTRAFENASVTNFRTIAGLYEEAVQLVTVDPTIRSVADLKGKVVSIGEPGSGVYFNAIDALTAVGLTEADITPQYQSFNDCIDSIKDGKIAAAFVVAGAPTANIMEICTSNDAYLVPIDGEVAEKMMQANPFYTVYDIPANTYKGQSEAVKTVAVKATLIVSADVDEGAVYNITKAIFDNAEKIGVEHAKGTELSVENATAGITVPFHKGAAKYFAEKGVTVATE